VAALPPQYLAKKGGQWRHVKLLDIATLLLNIHMAAKDEDVGFEDAQNTLSSITARLNKMVLLDPALIESGLWSGNLLNEKGRFVSPTGETFDEFVRRLLGRDGFNRIYNTIERKDG
jgi:hypothetical protein